MGLFDKKFCDFCGNKIGLLGNKKLEDANMCKDCAGKLSPWFSERRHSTKADIEKQLEYREQNKQAVASFSATRTLGTASTKLMIDDNARKFMVTSAKDINAANPDVLDFSQALGCDLDVKEHKHEIMTKDSNGNSVSYRPPRYKYSYEFHAVIRVNHPYFDDMRFALSSGSIDVGEQPMNPGQSGGWSVARAGISILGNKIDEYYKCVDCGNEIKAAVDAMRASGAAQAPAAAQSTSTIQDLEYQISRLRAKIEAGQQQGYVDPNDSAQYFLLNHQLVTEKARLQPMGAAGAMGVLGMMGSMGAAGAGMGMPMGQGLQQAPQGFQQVPQGYQQVPQGYQQMPQGQGYQPMTQAYQQVPQQAPQPQATPMPAAGSQVTCPVCGATSTLGAAGICIYCGNRLV